jgi:prepilin-type processing-associated H-X9-DG protein
MAAFEAKCPLCGAEFQSEDEWIGQVGECPSCGKEIPIQSAQPSPEQQTKKLSPKRTADENAIGLADPSSKLSPDEKRCPHCNEIINAKAQKCKFCLEFLSEEGIGGKNHQSPSSANAVAAQSSGLAVASLILGILSLLCFGPFFGIPAIILGLFALSKVKKGTGSGKGMAIAGISTGSVGIVLVIVQIAILAGMLLPALNAAREKARRISCASNLKQIGLAVRMYSQENNEQYPDKNGAEGLEMLRVGGYLENTKIYTCPSTTTAMAGGKLTEENVDYVYIGGRNESDNVDTVIAYDKPNNHNKFGNALFVDGHVAGFAGANWMDNIK